MSYEDMFTSYFLRRQRKKAAGEDKDDFQRERDEEDFARDALNQHRQLEGIGACLEVYNCSLTIPCPTQDHACCYLILGSLYSKLLRHHMAVFVIANFAGMGWEQLLLLQLARKFAYDENTKNLESCCEAPTHVYSTQLYKH